ncbi:MAG: 16S rRNA (guanine(527)-N(7))-methyltransferase RsmG [Oscillospiraceae bacterium]|nr:16S rRNA (guanine(527)-N(7))-methyltransferase RsmG [Oscillospiraceae bacterium]
MEKRIIEVFGGAGIRMSERQAEQFRILFEFMVEYNKNVNLTSITEFEDVIMKHFVDSVLPFTMVEFDKAASFIDVGTGAGFPSLPLLIMFPTLKGTLCDSLGKRCSYLELACDKIGVKAEVIHARGEELGRKRRELYDIATARAVAALPVLTELCLPFVKVGGRFIALKSVNEDVSAAANAIGRIGGELEKCVDYDLPNGDSRRLVVVKKISQTPTKYPRSYANITKKPL